MQKKDLFQSDKTTQGNFKVNKDFEKKYNYRKKREEIDRLKYKYQDQVEDFSSESSFTIDEDQVLGNDNHVANFLSTYAKLKQKEPEIYNKDIVYFKGLEEPAKIRKEKKLTIKDQIISELNNGQIKQDEQAKETPMEVQQRLKAQFMQAANNLEDSNLLVKKNKTSQQLRQEEIDYKKYFGDEDKKKEINVVEKFWGENSKNNLTSQDKFLRDYILKKKWLDKDDQQFQEEQIDNEDSNNSVQADEFEKEYNFRFEAGNGAFLQDPRNVQNTLRREDSKRKDKRQRLKDRKKDEKMKLMNELKQVKKSKKEKIVEQMLKLKQISNNNNQQYNTFLKNVLFEEFDEKYDQLMDKIFDDQYYNENEDKEEEIKTYLKNVEREIEGNKDDQMNFEQQKEFQQEKEEGLIPKSNIPIELKHKINNEEAGLIQNSTQKNLWWYCDNCYEGIQPANARFDCMECSDYSICKQCASVKVHNHHKIKRFMVPKDCFPPSNEEIQKIIKKFRFCQDCNNKINTHESYYKHKENTTYILCKGCINYIGKEFKLREFKQIKRKTTQIKDDKLQSMLQDYENLDFEDVIAGGIKTKYQYIDVEAEDYGLTDAELLFADDKVLNQMLSIKKLNPYRINSINERDRNKIRKMRALVRESAEKNQKKFLKEQKILQKEQELKKLAKKSKKYQKEYQDFMQNKDQMIEKIYRKDDITLNKMSYNKVEDEINKELGDEKMEISKEQQEQNERLKSYGLQQIYKIYTFFISFLIFFALSFFVVSFECFLEI